MLLAHDDLHVPGLSAADFETFLSAFQNAIGEGARTRLSLWEALKLALNSCGKLTSAQVGNSPLSYLRTSFSSGAGLEAKTLR